MANSLVSVSLSNVPFETAAATIAESAGLRAFRTGSVVVIVTSERAKKIDDANLASSLKSIGEMVGPFCAGFGPTPPSDKELKEKIINAKMKVLTGELEKLRKK